MLLVFVASTRHPGIDRGPRVIAVLRTLNYVSVFLLIAGSVTPLVPILFRTAYGWAVLGAVWVVAAVGIALRSPLRELPKYVTNTLHIAMGWMPAVLVGAGVPLPAGAYVLMAAGGLVYSVGFVVFVVERPQPPARRARLPRDLARARGGRLRAAPPADVPVRAARVAAGP